MTLDEAIKHAEEVADGHDRIKQIKAVTLEECIRAEEHRQLAEWLKELKQLREQTRWILVNERLPKEYKEVFVTDIETSDAYLSRYIGNGYWECDNGTFRNRIIAWQPLPQPYKVESEEVDGK